MTEEEYEVKEKELFAKRDRLAEEIDTLNAEIHALIEQHVTQKLAEIEG
jgi:hypothetical protein